MAYLPELDDLRAVRETTSVEPAEGARSGLSYLLVIEQSSSSIFELPAVGIVTIGRAPDVELRLDHSSVSRRHARLVMSFGDVRISDLESRNGTRVNGELIAGAKGLAAGDVIVIGEVVLVVHVPARVQNRAVLGGQAWRRCLDSELERTVSCARPFAVLVTSALPAEATERAGLAFVEALRAVDVVSAADDHRLLALLPEASTYAALQLATGASKAIASIVPGARVGIAACPSDAADADSLLVIARARMQATPEGAIGSWGDAARRLRLDDREVLVTHPAMVRVYELIERLGAADLPVLIVGETGVGKENAAYAVHHYSTRRQRRFVAVNCASFVESLLESELFGHARGAFSGAVTDKPGLFEAVAGGTLFLDEVGELTSAAQAKLLRVLETQRVTRVGETKEREVDVRVVAATHRVLEEDVRTGRFRQDLYFRLKAARVFLPPLRDRRCEILPLFRDFLARAAAKLGRDAPEPSPAVQIMLLTHGWAGNVRELKNVAEYAVAISTSGGVEPGDLPADFAPASSSSAPNGLTLPTLGAGPAPRRLAEEIEELERRRMKEALEATNGVKSRAASLLGMPIRTFTDKIKHYGIR